MTTVIGTNTMTDLVYGVVLNSGTSGVITNKQAVKGVASEYIDNGSGNFTVPPLASVNGSAAPAGTVGEIIRASVTAGSAVSLTTETAKAVTSVPLTAGDWDCRGDLAFLPAGGTTITLIAGGISNVPNKMPASGSNGLFFMDTSWTTGVGASIPISAFQINLSSATTEYLVAESNFGVSTMSAFGYIECRRMR